MAFATLKPSSNGGQFLPTGAGMFFRRRATEIVGLVLIALGMAAMIALITYHSTDPSLNRATGFAPRNLLGVPGATFADVMMQALGLGALVVPVAGIAWGVMLMRQHGLPFFGLRLALLLATTLLAASAAAALGDIGHWTPHAGASGVTGAALALHLRELTLTHSDGALLPFLAPLAAIAATALMVPVIGMKRGHLPIVFRALLLPVTAARLLVRGAISIWRGRPEREAAARTPQPEIGYAEIPGEIDASQYDPARFHGIPENGAPLPTRDTLLVDAPMSPIAGLRAPELPPDVPAAPAPLAPAPAAAPMPKRPLWARLFGRDDAVDGRVEPVLMAAAPIVAAPPAPVWDVAPPDAPAAVEDTPLPSAQVLQLPLRPASEPPAAPVPAPATPTVVVKRAAPQPGRRVERERQPELALGADFQLPPLDILTAAPKALVAAKVDEEALTQNARLLESVLEDFGVKGEIVKVRPGPVVTLYELEPAPGTKSSRVIGLADDIARSMSAVSVRVATVPGRNVIGIELPNARREMVYLRELLSSKDYEDGRLNLPMVLGKDIGGGPVIADLARMPHLLIGGTTGSGKSVGINTMILSLL
ncbi:MAG: DNA translocase FtsK 4TM domain-containing protein, partial [Rhodospirillales bacterium]|nr:DNA translocase FtsK 4TM domain-containing protein [Rhodospirillales bacterium]